MFTFCSSLPFRAFMLVILLAGCHRTVARNIELGQDIYRIPAENIISVSAKTASGKNGDQFGPALVLKWSVDQFYQFKGVTNTKKLNADIVASVSGPFGKAVIEKWADGERHKEPLLLIGSFENAVINAAELPNLYRVSRHNESRYSWEILSVKPDVNNKLPMNGDYWEGGCLLLTTGATLCEIELVFEKSYYVTVSIPGELFSDRLAVKSFITQTLHNYRIR